MCFHHMVTLELGGISLLMPIFKMRMLRVTVQTDLPTTAQPGRGRAHTQITKSQTVRFGEDLEGHLKQNSWGA